MGTRGRGGGAAGSPDGRGERVYPPTAGQHRGGGDPGRSPAPAGGSPPRCHVPPASGSARTRCSLRLREAPSHEGARARPRWGADTGASRAGRPRAQPPCRPGSRTLRGRPAARLAPPSPPPLAAGADVTSARAPSPLPTSGLSGPCPGASSCDSVGLFPSKPGPLHAGGSPLWRTCGKKQTSRDQGWGGCLAVKSDCCCPCGRPECGSHSSSRESADLSWPPRTHSECTYPYRYT